MEEKNQDIKFIVLDSTVLVGDYWLRSPSFQLLRVYLKNNKAILAVPKVVIEETCNKFDEQSKKAKTELQRAFSNLRRFLLEAPKYPDKEIEEATLDYKPYLEATLDEMKAQVMGYGEIPHSEIVQRDLRRRLPFQPSGKGYRDALIWETLLRKCLNKDGITVFITENTKDFYGPENQLHKDLEKELLEKGFKKGSVQVLRSVDEFTRQYVVPDLKSRKDFATLIQNYEFDGLNLQEACEDNIGLLLTAVDENPSALIHNPGVYEPQIDEIYIPREMTVRETSEISDTVLLVLFEFVAEVSFIYYMPWDEYASMSDAQSEEIQVLDAQWNEYTMRVSRTSSLPIACRLTFNTESRQVESFEVESVGAELEEHQ